MPVTSQENSFSTKFAIVVLVTNQENSFSTTFAIVVPVTNQENSFSAKFAEWFRDYFMFASQIRRVMQARHIFSVVQTQSCNC